jgi:hypothetical protein
MNQFPDRDELFRQMEERRRHRAKRSIPEKLAVAEELRDLQRALAPVRAANKAKRAAGKIEIRIKTK